MKVTYKCRKCNFKWSPKGDRRPSICISCGSDNIFRESYDINNMLSSKDLELFD